MKTIEFNLPVYYASAFINCDYSGLTDEEIIILDKFEEWGIKKYKTFYCINADVDNTEFKPYNDLTGMGHLGADICKYTFVIDDGYCMK